MLTKAPEVVHVQPSKTGWEKIQFVIYMFILGFVAMLFGHAFKRAGPEGKLSIDLLLDALRDTTTTVKKIPIIQWCTELIKAGGDLHLTNVVIFASAIWATIFILAQIFG